MKTPAQDKADRPEAGSVSTAQYVAEMSGGIFQHYEDIPAAIRPRLERRRDGGRAADFAGMLKHGKEWVIAPLKELQPRSHAAFQEVVGPLLLGIVLIKDLMNPDGPPLVTPVMFFDASGRMLQVRPTFAGCTYEEGVDTLRGTLQSLPAALAKSWLWRTEGWRIPGEAFQGPLVNRCMVRHPMQGWEARRRRAQELRSEALQIDDGRPASSFSRSGHHSPEPARRRPTGMDVDAVFPRHAAFRRRRPGG